MNGEIPSVPITTLAGVASLTDLLPQLPLPTPLPHSVSNKSLLYHSSLRDEAQKLLYTKDANAISQLVAALRKTNTDDIELKDNTSGDITDVDGPPLLKGILAYDPNVFKGGPKYNTANNANKENNAGGVVGPSALAHEESTNEVSVPSPVSVSESAAKIPQPTVSVPVPSDSPPSVPHNQPAPAPTPANPYQAAFLNFAARQKENNTETVSSPAHAAAAPSDAGHQKSGQASDQPVVLLDPIQEGAHTRRRSASPIMQSIPENEILITATDLQAKSNIMFDDLEEKEVAENSLNLDLGLHQKSLREPLRECTFVLNVEATPFIPADKTSVSGSKSIESDLNTKDIDLPCRRISSRNRRKSNETEAETLAQDSNELQFSKSKMDSEIKPKETGAHEAPVRRSSRSRKSNEKMDYLYTKDEEIEAATTVEVLADKKECNQEKSQDCANQPRRSMRGNNSMEKDTDQDISSNHIQNPLEHNEGPPKKLRRSRRDSSNNSTSSENINHLEKRYECDSLKNLSLAVVNQQGLVIGSVDVEDGIDIQASDECEVQVDVAGINDEMPEVKKKKHRDSSFAVINSALEASKLTLKISKAKESRRDQRHGSKRRRSEDDDVSITEASNHSAPSGEPGSAVDFNASLSERVKRRRRQVNYKDAAGGDAEEGPEVISDEDDDVIILDRPSSRLSSSSKKDRKRRRGEQDGDYRPAEDPVSKLLDAPPTALRGKERDAPPTAVRGKDRDAPPTAVRSKDRDKLWDRSSRHEPMDARNGEQGSSGPSRRPEPRMKTKLLTGPLVILEDCMETSPTLKKFLNLIEQCMEAAEDVDIQELNADDDCGDSILNRAIVSDLCYEAAKLKANGKMKEIPYEKLVKLLTILQFNIRDGCKAVPVCNDDEDDELLLREITLEKTLGAIEAGLVALYIMTAADMPKEVYLEDVIDRLVRMTKTQLQNTIFPEFDPVYRTDPRNKTGYQGNLKAKRARSGGTKNRTVLQIYNKITELIAHMAELVEIQELTDTIILQTSTLSVSPFFVENINELQLNALKLVTSIFSKYDKHRQLILEDLLASLARLPSSKKNLRSYRLNADEQIQMVSALVLQLIQCVVVLSHPEMLPPGEVDPDSSRTIDREVVITTSYEHAMRTAHNFLSVFLKKCTTKGEDDYRHLFENFVYDLLATVNKPEWPAAELLLSLLGRLLVQQFSNKAVDMSLRVASLDYLGIVASRLRRDEVSSRLNEKVIDQIIRHIQGKEDESEEEKDTTGSDNEANKDAGEEGNQDDKDAADSEGEEDEDKASTTSSRRSGKQKKKQRRKSRRSSRRSSVESKEESEEDEEEEEEKTSKKSKSKKKVKETKKKKVDDSRTQHLQQSLLEYLVYNAQNDPALIFAREFYIGQWYRDCGLEVERATRKSQKVKSNKEKDEEDIAEELDRLKSTQTMAETRKGFLMAQINTKVSIFASFKPSPSRLHYDHACLVTRYLASSRPFSQSFEVYLTQILKVLCETAVAVRTRAMKCLSLVVEADPSILGRADMKGGVHGRLLDHSTSVREAAVELVGKFIHNRPELAEQYYEMLSDRILDTGISVRKRVIKIFRDICTDQPEFPKIPEMCVKMIRRVNDEEGIKKLVNETFLNMWFTPLSDREENMNSLLRIKVMNITDVVTACRDTGYEWFEHLLDNLLEKEEKLKERPVERACQQLIECLIENVLKLEGAVDNSTEGSCTCSPRMVSCVCTLHLFCKVKAVLMVRHTTILQPYLDIKCIGAGDYMVIHNIARILELSVPLMDHPSENFLAQLEEDMMKLILKHGMMVLQSCVSCLGAIVNDVTHNYKLVRDCFQKFFGVLSRLMQVHKHDPQSPQLVASMPTMLRSLFTVGLLCRHFDFDSEDFGERRVTIKDRVFDVLMYFVSHEEEDVRHKALSGIGFFATRHYEFMMGKELKDLYQDLLVNRSASVKMCCQVLRNLNHYLIEEENRMLRAEHEWKKEHDKEDLKEMGDVQSGMASTIIQVYIKHLLESFFHSQSQVRFAALNVVVLVLRQGLVHPVQIVPYLISMGSDCDTNIRIKADQQLAEIDKKYPGFIQMKATQGVKMSFRLQTILQQDPCEPIRGLRVEENPVALCTFIYSLIRSNRGQRRGMITSILNMFDDSVKTPLNELIYTADNMSAFPYQVQDEPLFLIHQIDILVSVSGSNVLQTYKEIFYPGSVDEEGKNTMDDEDDDDVEQLLEKVPEDLTQLNELYLATQGCLLVLMLKQHVKDMYGITEVKLQRYLPSEMAKVWDRPLNRKPGYEFSPKPVLDLIKKLPLPSELDKEGRRQLVQDYIDFKGLMLSIDPNEEEDEDDLPKPKTTPAAGGEAPEGGGATATEGASVAPEANNSTKVIDLDDSGDKEELQAKSMSTALTTSKSSYNRLLSLVTSSSSKKDTSKEQSRPSRSSGNRTGGGGSSSRRSHHRGGGDRDRDHSAASGSKSHKKKKKKRKRIISDSEPSDSDNSSDPDFTM